MNSLPKYVVSTTLRKTRSSGATPGWLGGTGRGAEAEAARAGCADLRSGELVRTLMQHDLILMVFQAGEHFALGRKPFYLHAPNGVGRSKLFASIERVLGVPDTARNWRTVRRLMEMVDQ